MPPDVAKLRVGIFLKTKYSFLTKYRRINPTLSPTTGRYGLGPYYNSNIANRDNSLLSLKAR